jgi:hypothetical protein
LETKRLLDRLCLTLLRKRTETGLIIIRTILKHLSRLHHGRPALNIPLDSIAQTVLHLKDEKNQPFFKKAESSRMRMRIPSKANILGVLDQPSESWTCSAE